MTVKEFLDVCDFPTVFICGIDDWKKYLSSDLSSFDKDRLHCSPFYLRCFGVNDVTAVRCFSSNEIKKIKFIDNVIVLLF